MGLKFSKEKIIRIRGANVRDVIFELSYYVQIMNKFLPTVVELGSSGSDKNATAKKLAK